MLIRILSLIVLVPVLCFTSCDTLDRPEEIPSYIYINNFTLTTDVGVEGENTHEIIDAWVYKDNDLLGVYTLPARVPILAEGSTNIRIKPGVKQNGLASTRVAYPFYKEHVTTIDLVRDSVITINPSTSYKDNLEFEIDDFESAGQLMVQASDSDVGWDIQTGGPTGKFGRIKLDNGNTLGNFHTDDNYSFPRQGAQVYLEIDIRTDNPVSIGIIDELSSGVVDVYNNYGINAPDATPVWKKLYFSLTDVLSYEVQGNQHEFFLNVFTGLNPAPQEAQVDIDNIKIVYFQ